MFARFRQARGRLQVSVVETRRTNSKVRHAHIASFGSVKIPPSVRERITFWRKLFERLAKLGNRVDADTAGKILDAIHARIPMVSMDEQRALQLETATSDARFWSGIHDMNAGTVEDHKQLAATTAAAIEKGETAAAAAAARAAAAKDRAERIARGENVEGGLGRPLTYEDFVRIMKEAGMTDADIEHCQELNEVWTALGDETFRGTVREEMRDARTRAERRIIRAWHTRLTAREPED
jgi:hypothetical protein